LHHGPPARVLHTQFPAPSHCELSRNCEQYAPSAAKAVGVHTGLPLEQSIAAAVTHSLNVVHDIP
jgi:hypothetical protein